MDKEIKFNITRVAGKTFIGIENHSPVNSVYWLVYGIISEYYLRNEVLNFSVTDDVVSIKNVNTGVVLNNMDFSSIEDLDTLYEICRECSKTADEIFKAYDKTCFRQEVVIIPEKDYGIKIGKLYIGYYDNRPKGVEDES